jgi:hypothetical protein
MRQITSILVIAVLMISISSEVYALDYVVDASISASEQYNDNIYLSQSNRKGDFITVVNPVMAISRTAEDGSLAINYSPFFNFYAAHDERNSISHQATLRGSYRLSNSLTFNLSEAFMHSQESSVLRTVEGGGPIISGQRMVTNNVLNGELIYRLSGPFSIQGNAIHNLVNNAGTDAGDFHTYAGRLGINYILDERITLRVTSIFTYYDYRITGDANSMDFNLGFNWRVTPTVTLDGYGGIIITTLEQESRTVNGFSGGLTVTKRFERGSAILNYAHGVTAGIQSAAPMRSHIVTLRYDTPVTEQMTLSLSAFYGNYSALGGMDTDAGSNRDEYGGTLNMAYRLSRYLSAIMTYSHVRSNSRATSGVSYSNNIIMLGLRLFDQFRF